MFFGSATRRNTVPAFGFVFAAAVMMLSVAPSAQRATQAVPLVKTVYVSAVDRKEVPVTDLTAREFVLREGGDVRKILKIEPATTPIRIAIIVDDSGTGIFRVPVANFVNQLLGSAEFAIKHVIAQAVRLVDYTSDVELLRNAILRLGVRAETPDGGRVVEAVFDPAGERLNQRLNVTVKRRGVTVRAPARSARGGR